MATLRTGGDVDSYCTKCRMMLGHTILAMRDAIKIARVRCNTCQGEHAYKAGPPGTVTAKAPKAGRTGPAARTTRTKVEHKSFETLLAAKDESRAKLYSPKDRFKANDLLRHPSFGLGIVQLVRLNKIDVLFQLGEKTFLHDRGEAAAKAPDGQKS